MVPRLRMTIGVPTTTRILKCNQQPCQIGPMEGIADAQELSIANHPPCARRGVTGRNVHVFVRLSPLFSLLT